MIDSHCHLADEAFADDLEVVIARAREAGVEKMVTIADTLAEGERCIAIAEKFPQVYCTVGVHPHAVKEWREGDRERLETLVSRSKKVRAIGEIGLDFHYDFSPRDTQRGVFREQLLLAKELGLPVVIHCREAVDDVWDIVSEVSLGNLVLHCCTEAWDVIARFVERGYFLSFTGIATYPKSEAICDTIRQCPLGKLMVETDAPYLAPVPHRGKRNEPAFVMEIAKLIAALKGVSLQEVDEATTRNAVEFFGMPR